MKQIMFCLVATLLISWAGFSQRTILQENFNDNHNNWGLYPNSKPIYALYNGKYIMDIHDSSAYISIIPVNMDSTKNYSISIVTVHTAGVDSYAYGLAFGGVDVSNNYVFNLSANGYFALGKYVAGGYYDIVKWTASPVIKTGNFVENKLQVKKDGKSWKLFVNDQLVFTTDALPLMGNKIGCDVSRPQRIEFDDLVVSQ